MDYKEREAIDALKLTINQFKVPVQKRFKKADDANKLWNAALLFSKVVKESKPFTRLFSREDFEEFTNQYNLKYSTNIDGSNLFEKFWLREVLGFVYITDAVRVVTNDYEKYKNLKNEVFFLRCLFQNYPEKTIEKSVFAETVRLYEVENDLKISEEWMANTNWVKPSKEEDILKIGNVDYLFNLLDNWNDFAFLHTFKKQFQKKQERKFEIDSKILTQILGKHKAYFPLTPSLFDFENNNLFQKIGNSYFYKTTQNEINYWYDLIDEISGHYWEALMQDNSFSNDEERMLHFIDVILKGARWPDIQDYVSDASKKSLLTTSINLIEREQDIIGVEDEFSKCYLDQHLGSSHYGFQSNKPIPEETFDDTDDILDRYRQLQHISSKYQSNIFYVQESRKELAFLVRLVVLLDKEYDTVDIDGKSLEVHYHNIKKLLRSGLEKPYLIWEVVHFIKQNRPEVIPYLSIETDLCALGFDMLNKTKFEIDIRKAKHILRKQFLSDGLNLLLNSYLRAQAIDKTKTAHLVFQLFQKITKEKVYSLSHIRLAEERRLLITEREDLEEQLLGILETSNLNGGFVGGSSKQSFLYHIFPELNLELENHRSKSKYLNGVIGLSFIKLDVLCWLSRFLLIAEYKLSQISFTNFKTNISSSFVACYIEKIEQNKVIKREFYSSELIESLPSWSVQNEVLVTLDWLSPITIAYESGNLNDFLNPRFTLKNTDDKYDKHNRFQANKIRTHLFILLLILKAIQKQKNYSKQAFILDVKKTVELTIVSLLKRYAQEGLAHNQNILDQEYDRQHFRTIESELLPFIIEMGDVFEDKSALFDQLVNTENIVQLLYICSHSETEGIKESVIKRIHKLDIPSFLDKQIWRPEIIYVVTELSKIPELQSKAKIALNEWNKLNSKRNIERETEKEIFEAQLMQAYYANDEYGIQSLKEPESGYIIHNEFKPKDHKQFFIGLIRYKNEPEKAYQIFNNLINKYPKYATFALNRFGAKVELALKNEKKEQFLEGITEWLEYEKTCPLSVLETVVDKTNYNKLTVFLNLEDKDSFNMLYEELDEVRRLSPDMVKLRVQMLVKYELINEARMVVANALSFHKALNQNAFEFLTELESKISKSNPVEEIKTAINKLSTDTKNSMDSVIPLQYEDNFGKKMANEIIIASRRFLTNPKAYNPNADEDDYSSIIKQILENKLSTFGFHINDQPKGGSSASGKKAGERDLVICDTTGELSIIEAFKHSTKTVVQKHISKIFDYTHMRDVFFILAYDLKPSTSFKKRWEYYKTNMLKKLTYPIGYELENNDILDMTNDFGHTSSAIRICRTTHNNGTEIYHIMLNVDYFV